MHRHFNPLMGFSDSPMFLSGRDSPSHPLEKECIVFSPMQQHFHNVSQNFEDHQGQEQEERKSEVLLSPLMLKWPAGMADHEEEKDGCKTPASKDHEIPPPLVCPPPPRKPKWMLPATLKKKGSGRRVFLDMSREVEALFPPALLADFGNKIKKVRKQSIII